jgi:hypothetical protein
MEPEADMPAVESVDLSPLAPRHTDAVYARVAARALELRRLRRAVVRRGAIAVIVAAAAGLALFLSAPRRDQLAPRGRDHGAGARGHSADILDLGFRSDVDPYELFDLGGTHAQ